MNKKFSFIMCFLFCITANSPAASKLQFHERGYSETTQSLKIKEETIWKNLAAIAFPNIDFTKPDMKKIMPQLKGAHASDFLSGLVPVPNDLKAATRHYYIFNHKKVAPVKVKGFQVLAWFEQGSVRSYLQENPAKIWGN